MKKYYGLIIWGLLLILTLFLALIIPKEYTAQIWTILVFDVIAFLSQFITWFAKAKSSKETFYKYPSMTMSSIYLILQFGISTLTAIINTGMPFELLLIIEAILLVIMWILILSTLMAKDKIESLDSRQKDHHIEL